MVLLVLVMGIGVGMYLLFGPRQLSESIQTPNDTDSSSSPGNPVQATDTPIPTNTTASPEVSNNPHDPNTQEITWVAEGITYRLPKQSTYVPINTTNYNETPLQWSYITRKGEAEVGKGISEYLSIYYTRGRLVDLEWSVYPKYIWITGEGFISIYVSAENKTLDQVKTETLEQLKKLTSDEDGNPDTEMHYSVDNETKWGRDVLKIMASFSGDSAVRYYIMVANGKKYSIYYSESSDKENLNKVMDSIQFP